MKMVSVCLGRVRTKWRGLFGVPPSGTVVGVLKLSFSKILAAELMLVGAVNLVEKGCMIWV